MDIFAIRHKTKPTSQRSTPSLMVLWVMCLACVCGCSALSLGEKLPVAISGHDDPETVREAAPAYLIMADALVLADEEDVDSLISGAKLYTAYSALFVEDSERLQKLTARGFGYASSALCIEYKNACGLDAKPVDEVKAFLATMDEDDVELLHPYALSWLVWMQARASDPVVLARLPKAELILQRVLDLDERYDGGSAHLYMGLLKTLRPPALGGKPEEALAHFERAWELSGERNLAAKLAIAERYARMLYERELHDRVLGEVLDSTVDSKEYMLSNTLARQRARELLDTAEEYF